MKNYLLPFFSTSYFSSLENRNARSVRGERGNPLKAFTVSFVVCSGKASSFISDNS